MEYLVGSVATVIAVVVGMAIRSGTSRRRINMNIEQSQSRTFEVIKTTEEVLSLLNPKVATQATAHRDSNMLRVIFVDSQAYWIKESVFYTADVDELGFIDVESTRAVDTMTMNEVQLDKMIFIVEKLTEGK